MKATFLLAAATTLALVGCHSKNQGETALCLGCYATKSEAQADADRQNAARAQVTAKDKALGVHQEYLPCGRYEPVQRPDGYWYVQENRTGCPATAGQLDPHPGPVAAPKAVRKAKPGGKTP